MRRLTFEDGTVRFPSTFFWMWGHLALFFILLLLQLINYNEAQFELAIPIRLPDKNIVKFDEISPLTLMIAIRENGSVLVHGEEYGKPGDKKLSSLCRLLVDQDLKQQRRDPIVIQCAALAKYERLIDVLNAASRAHVDEYKLLIDEGFH